MARRPENLEIFTPRNFEEFIGQSQAKKIAQVIVQAALNERRKLPNVIIDGEYGLGKTTLAKIMLKSMGHEVKIYDSAALNKEIPPLSGTVIVDEIHNLDAMVCDSLNILLDRGDFTIIGCTTNPGMLPMAFRSRFRSIHLERYTKADLSTILDASCLRRGLSIAPAMLRKIADRSRGNTRVALTYLAFIFDLMSAGKVRTITSKVVSEAFQLLGVDDLGLTDKDREYLKLFINKSHPLGIQYISARLGMDQETIEQEIEPYLMQLGLVDRTNRGRIFVG